MSLSNGVLIVSCALPAILSISAFIKKPIHQLAALALVISGITFVTAACQSWQQSASWMAPSWLAVGLFPIRLELDPLSAFFMLLLGIITICSAVYSPCYLAHLDERLNRRCYWSALFAFVGGMAGVLMAADAVVFLVSWELMSMSSALLVLTDFRQQKAQRASFNYLVATRIATAFLSCGFLLMFAKFGSWSFAVWRFDEMGTWLAAGLILVGLSIKAGVWPFHIWLPYAHPEAPSPVSALMSGVMVKIAIYAALRFFVLGRLNCQPLIYILFTMAGISAFWGILFAINQREIKRLLAYSTVENIGLIFIAFALSVWAASRGLSGLFQIAILGTLLHCFAHGLFKSLLFLSAGSVDHSAHSRDFALLGGLSKSMPYTTALFVIGSSSNCALPPLNGFVSKWCIYQALLRSAFTMPVLTDRAICLAAIGLLSCVGALAIACFAKTIGVAFLGKARTGQAAAAQEVPRSMILPQVFLSAACVIGGIATPWLVKLMDPVLLYLGVSNLSPDAFDALPLWQVALSNIIFIGAIYGLVFARRPFRYKTWDCGFGSLTTKAQVTADSFAQPIARIFTPVLRHKLVVDISGRDRRHFPEKITVEPSIVSLLETKLYGPAAAALTKISLSMAKLQAGSIHLYLLYVCIALVLLMLIGTQLW